MFEKNPRLNTLESRKQLLIAESELNRARMLDDATALKAEVCGLSNRLISFRTIVASAAALVSGLSASSRGEPADAKAKPSFFRTVLRGAGLVFQTLAGVSGGGRRSRDGDSSEP